MPRRRVTTAAQKAASRRNLQKARAAKKTGVPQGKNVLMVHATNAKAKGQILREQLFRPSPKASDVGKDHVFLVPYSQRKNRDFVGKYGYGRTAVVVSVPRKAIKADADWPHQHSRMVPAKALQGRQIRGLKRGE